MMATIAWNPVGFHLFNAPPKGNTFIDGPKTLSRTDNSSFFTKSETLFIF
jgi:hypothetical protein